MMTKLNFEKRVFADCGNVWSEISSFNITDGTTEMHQIFHIENIHESYKNQLNNICNALKKSLSDWSDFSSPFCRVFLSDAANQQNLLSKKLKGIDYKGTISIIQQPPLDGSKIAIWCYLSSHLTPSTASPIKTYSHNGYTHFWNTQIGENGDSFQQTVDLINNEVEKLRTLKMSIKDNCIRTWFYMQNIDTTYHGMVKARRLEFEKLGLSKDTHYITSTGIEGRNGNPNELVHLDSYNVNGLKNEQIQFLYGTTHLNPTIEYGVTFERGVQIIYGDRKHIFLSGTASINNKGEIMHENDIVKQTYRMLENCSVLLSEANATLNDFAQVIIYLRDMADYSIVKEIFDKELPKIPKVILLAPVCRPGWLIEIEGIALTEFKAPNYNNY
jgi:enamine deaminase RidA (YjgF/YER057c/UK114 family)